MQLRHPSPSSTRYGWALLALGVLVGTASFGAGLSMTCAITGSTKLSHLVDNQAAGRGRLPDAAMRRKMEEYWDRKP